jgi:hypothetical protein
MPCERATNPTAPASIRQARTSYGENRAPDGRRRNGRDCITVSRLPHRVAAGPGVPNGKRSCYCEGIRAARILWLYLRVRPGMRGLQPGCTCCRLGGASRLRGSLRACSIPFETGFTPWGKCLWGGVFPRPISRTRHLLALWSCSNPEEAFALWRRTAFRMFVGSPSFPVFASHAGTFLWVPGHRSGERGTSTNPVPSRGESARPGRGS